MLQPGIEAQTHLFDSNMHELQKSGHALKGNAPKSKEKMVDAAKNFESFMMSYMFKEMYNSIPKSDVFGNSDAQNMFMGLYVDEISKRSGMSQNGIASQIMKQYEAYQKQMDKSSVNQVGETQLEPNKSVTGKLKKLVYEYGQNHTVGKVYNDFDQMIAKMEDKISSEYGMRQHPIHKKERMHHGIDVALADGTDVKVPSKGKVTFAGDKGGYGNAVVIDHGFGISSMYAHLSKIAVKEGQLLTRDDLVGQVGSTGVSTGPHLHFEVLKDGKAINPMHLDEGK